MPKTSTKKELETKLEIAENALNSQCLYLSEMFNDQLSVFRSCHTQENILMKYPDHYSVTVYYDAREGSVTYLLSEQDDDPRMAVIGCYRGIYTTQNFKEFVNFINNLLSPYN